MSTATYYSLNNSNVTWFCAKCDQPNTSSSLLDSYISESQNSFAALSDLPDGQSEFSTCSDTSSFISIGTIEDLDSPPRTSSPQRARRSKKNNCKSFKVLTVNFQSIRNKKEAFWEAVESCNPDIIVGSETWLRPDILSSEILPPGYNLPAIRKDRNDGYGGVLIATKSDIIVSEVSIDTNKEIVAAEMKIVGGHNLIVICLYRPPDNNIASAEEICSAISGVVRNNPSSAIWISGDLNLPDINWQTETVTGHQYNLGVNSAFLSTFQDLCLSQIVDFPTRGQSILDVFLTNRPSLIRKCIPLPGISDHDMVLTVADIRAKIQRPIKRKVYLWKKANMDTIREAMASFAESYLAQTSLDTPVESQWTEIKSKILSALEEDVPSKMTSCRFSQPWITTELKRLSRKKKRSFRRS
ncbi:uncharacterized protein LOC135157548 [Lytechinus pictus]|uniref:uncharacterized protein LOC135157548 n=1 Tax=Lytechinus pictus TaxID=7653 RepID=UPI0030B9BF9E